MRGVRLLAAMAAFFLPTLAMAEQFAAPTDAHVNGAGCVSATREGAAQCFLDRYRAKAAECVQGTVSDGNCKTVVDIYGTAISYTLLGCEASTNACRYSYKNGPYGAAGGIASIRVRAVGF